jgi:hypothetical protein
VWSTCSFSAIAGGVLAGCGVAAAARRWRGALVAGQRLFAGRLIAGHEAAQVQLATAVQEDAAVEVLQRDRADIHVDVDVAGTVARVDRRQSQPVPAGKAVAGGLVHHLHPPQSGAAVIADVHRMIALMQRQRAAPAEPGARQPGVELGREIRLQRRDIEPDQLQFQVRGQRRRGHRAADLQPAFALQLGTQGHR